VPPSNLEHLETAVEGFLAKQSSPTPAGIRELIQTFRIMPFCDVDDAEAELLARRFESRHGVTMTIGSVLTEKDHEPWLDAAKAGITPYYWDRYKTFLEKNKHFANQVVSTLDEVTDRILGRLQDPNKEGPWDRRGMVVGHVQSGKTANYTGLICKAADAGYKLIVVIAGLHNNLRNQTQIRIDEGFVGRDSARLLDQTDDRFIGVGRYDQTRRPVTFTNSVRDFTKQLATSVGIPLQDLKEPAVFVIKKHPTTLKNLIEWLREHNAGRGNAKVDIPMLLIDDEADNASINIKYKTDEVSRINGQLRKLLDLFERSCYTGYTATPFANIFIDPNSDDEMCGHDLFPKHFIVSLSPPSNYFGPDRVFNNAGPSVIKHIDDNEDLLPLRHKIDHPIVALPPSLMDAIRAFVLTRAIRLARGHHDDHCSMLVNASRFTNVQSQLRNEIHTQLERIKASVRINGALPAEEAVLEPAIAELHTLWRKEYPATGQTWKTVLKHLFDAVAPIKVVEVNSKSSGQLNYAEHSSQGLNIIAVGGFSLSRGLTLEGLTISYFLRNSMMYDTLMQMGRWFGYRPDYEDLCRVWMPEEAEGWYEHIAESIEMLLEDLRQMESAGATPEEFGLRVRSHPDTLIVTARNKIGTGEEVRTSIGLSNQFIETHTLTRSDAVLANNLEAAVRLVHNIHSAGRSAATPDKVTSGWLLKDVPVSVVKQFCSEFDNHPGSWLTDSDPLSDYIQVREADELSEWDVLFTSLQHHREDAKSDNSLGIPIVCQNRSAGSRSDATTLRISNKQRVSSRGVERTGLTPSEIAGAEATFRGKTDKAEKVNYPDRIYRAVRKRPLLIVHLLDVTPESGGAALPFPVVAWSISFPRTNKEEQSVTFTVNTTWMGTGRRDVEDDELELDGDDD
jgi:hypothetical protein